MAQKHFLIRVREGYTAFTPYELLKDNEDGTIWVYPMDYKYNEQIEDLEVTGRRDYGRLRLHKHEDGYYYQKHGSANKFYLADIPVAWFAPMELWDNRLLLYLIWQQFALKLGITINEH